MMHDLPSGLKNSAPNSQKIGRPIDAPLSAVTLWAAHFASCGLSFQSESFTAQSTNSVCVQSLPGSFNPAAETAFLA